MNTHVLMGLLPGLTVLFLLLGFYKTVLEKQVQTQEHVQELLGQPRREPSRYAKTHDHILKKRKKNTDANAQALRLSDRLDMDLERANMLITAQEFIAVSVGVLLLGGFLGYWLVGQNTLLAIPLGLGAGLAPYGLLRMKAFLRMRKAAAQFADVLDAMVNAFKTGFGFSRAVQMVADNFDDPWGTEFGKMSAEMNLGASQEDALYSLARRMPSADMDLFVTGLLIQKETGGSLAELVGNLSKTIRERYKLFQKVGAISAQGKLSAGIVCCVPFFLAAVMFLFLPEPMSEFVTNPIGIVLLVIAGLWMCVGIGVLYKIVDIEV